MILRVYKCEVQASRLQIAKYQKAIEDKDVILTKNKPIILHLEGDMLNKSKKLKKANYYAFE